MDAVEGLRENRALCVKSLAIDMTKKKTILLEGLSPWIDSPASNQSPALSSASLDCGHSLKHLRQ